MSFWNQSFLSDCEESSFCVLPVDNLPDLLDVVETDVLVVDVVGMLPDIDGYLEAAVLRRGVRPAGASISWLASSRILSDLELLS